MTPEAHITASVTTDEPVGRATMSPAHLHETPYSPINSNKYAGARLGVLLQPKNIATMGAFFALT